MILKAHSDLDNLMFGIRNIRWFYKPDVPMYSDEEKSRTSMTFYLNVDDVKHAYTDHDVTYMDPNYVVIFFYDGTRLEVELDGDSVNLMKNANGLIDAIFKMKMLGTKWEQEHPEKYV